MTKREFATMLVALWNEYEREQLVFYREYERRAKERLPEFMVWLEQELQDMSNG